MSLSDVSSRIRDIIKNLDDVKNLEIEARIKDVSEGDFSMLNDYLKSIFDSEESNTVDYFKNKERISKIDNKYYNTSKKSIYYSNIYHKNNKVKINVVTENNKLLDIEDVKKFEFKREKERTTYTDNNLKYDMTKVTEYPAGNVSYEFEIEVIDPSLYDSVVFEETIDSIIEFINEYKSDIVRFCNISLSDGKDDRGDEIKYYLISKPRDLKKKDMTNTNSILRNFTISIKADGIQYFLLFHKSGIWLISLTKPSIRICGLTKDFSHLEDSMFVGEILNKENLKPGTVLTSSCVFLPFDTISYKNKSVVNKSYTERISYLKEILSKYIYCNGVKKIKVIEKKIFNLGDTSKSFYKTFIECFKERKKIEYKDDGYIFTPINSPYVTEGQSIKKQSERTLDRYLDVCKFKPVEKRSVDFKIINGKLYNTFGKGDLEIFDDLDYNLDFDEDIEGKIVEFSPLQLEGDIILSPSRIRHDKVFPNRKEAVREIVSSYFEQNPITDDTLSGKDTVLMRNFNNSIKRRLIDDIEGYVVDIGAGNGGDIGKFGSNKKIKKVFSIEPNKEFSEEFEYRLKSSKWKDKFKLLSNTKGEDTEIIISGLKDFLPKEMKEEKITVTFMISLSFFWSSPEILNSISRTLSEINDLYKSRNGKGDLEVVFYTIEGERVRKLFEKHGKNSIKLNTINLSLGDDNQVLVDISDSKTVFQQIEYLVDLNMLFEKAGLEKIYLRAPIIDKKLLMSAAESIYIGLFVYGKYKLTNKPTFSYKLSRLEVDIKKGRKVDKKILARGDDISVPMNFIGPDIFRISTMDLNMSLSNSIAKLINEDYRNGDVHKRIEISKALHKKIGNMDMDKVSKHIGYGIKVYYGKEIDKYGLNSKKWIILNMCFDKTYEPIVYKTDVINYVFSDNSFLIK